LLNVTDHSEREFAVIEFLDRLEREEDRLLLDERRLLFRFIEGTRPRYRTRMAEAVRFFSKLRQIFPGRPWQLAPTLVADFRLTRVPRRYPHIGGGSGLPPLVPRCRGGRSSKRQYVCHP
jgi:hypothetical protein